LSNILFVNYREFREKIARGDIVNIDVLKTDISRTGKFQIGDFALLFRSTWNGSQCWFVQKFWCSDRNLRV